MGRRLPGPHEDERGLTTVWEVTEAWAYYAGQAIEPRRRQEMPAFEARAGEHRAYADGKDAYQQLADGIAAKGEELAKKK